MTTHFNPASCPSPSALRVAASRALHQLLDTQRVFDDPFAIGILGAATAAQLMLDPDAHNDVTARSMRAGMVARSRFAEDRVLRAIAAGVQQYVIVGAGLDTWALRHAQTLPSVEVFELDQPAMQQWKQQMLLANGWRLHPRLHWVPVDLREQAALQDPQRLGWSRSSPSVISMLGVLVYLHQQEVAHSLQRLRALPAGSVLVLDYRLEDQCLPPLERSMMQFTGQMMAAGGEPWLSAHTPDGMRQLLAEAGFTVEEDLGPQELNTCYFARRRDGLQIAGGGFRYLSAIKH